MDPTSPFPGSWNLVKRNLPSLVGAGIGAIAGSLSAGARAYRQAKLDQRVKFQTWSERKMPVIRPARRVSYRRIARRPYRRYTRSKGMVLNGVKRFVRTSAVKSFSISASTTAFGSFNCLLSDVQTSDLTPQWRLYRIRKIVMKLVPRVDTANSGVTNNYSIYAAAACDPESTSAPTTIQQITAYDNSHEKFLPSGSVFQYTFYPKVTNSVDISGVATAAGSYAMNPWLRLDATGITVPHLSLKYGLATESTSTATSLA